MSAETLANTIKASLLAGGVANETDGLLQDTCDAIAGGVVGITGEQEYSEQNYVTDGETLTASLDALDVQVKDVTDAEGLNTTHSSGDGSDHADVAQNTSDIAALQTVWEDVLTGCFGAVYTATGYMYFDGSGFYRMSATAGYPMPKAGSIVGISALIECTAITTPGNVRPKAFINAGAALSILVNITSTGEFTGYTTVAPGTYPFNAGDLIQIKNEFVAGQFVGTLRKTLIRVYVRMP